MQASFSGDRPLTLRNYSLLPGDLTEAVAVSVSVSMSLFLSLSSAGGRQYRAPGSE